MRMKVVKKSIAGDRNPYI